MKVKTNLGQILDGVPADELKYNTTILKILSDKTILAWILKYTIDVYRDYAIEQIRECIEGVPEIHQQKVIPGETPEEIVGMSEKELIFDEGETYFDIRFCAYAPNGELTKFIVNIEAQNDYYVGYDIVTRAIFYCARMISSQYGKEFTKSNYQDIRKVYSIWLCTSVPKKMEYTIARYKMSKSDIYGNVPDGEYYDLLEAIIICLGDESNKSNGTKLHQLMSTLLSESMEPEQKKSVLKQEFKIDTSVELEGRLINMCNLADGIEAKGKAEGRAEGRAEELVALVKDGLLKKEVAAERLSMSLEEFEELLVAKA